jgi:hypothetical protein
VQRHLGEFANDDGHCQFQGLGSFGTHGGEGRENGQPLAPSSSPVGRPTQMPTLRLALGKMKGLLNERKDLISYL